MSEPRTEAGRSLLDEGDVTIAGGSMREYILAIEEEAVARPFDETGAWERLREAVAIVLHRWKHPTFRMGEQGCRCRADAAMAVDIAQPELTADQPPHSDARHIAGYREDCPACIWLDDSIAARPSDETGAWEALRAVRDELFDFDVPATPERAMEIKEQVYAALAANQPEPTRGADPGLREDIERILSVYDASWNDIEAGVGSAESMEYVRQALAANPAPAGPLTCAGCGDYIAGEFYHSECQRGLARLAPAAEEA